MEFLVRIVAEKPSSLTEHEWADLRVHEVRRGKELQDARHMKRFWQVPGRRHSIGLFEAKDATELHALLVSLPFYPYLQIDVEPLATTQFEMDNPPHTI